MNFPFNTTLATSYFYMWLFHYLYFLNIQQMWFWLFSLTQELSNKDMFLLIYLCLYLILFFRKCCLTYFYFRNSIGSVYVGESDVNIYTSFLGY